MKKVAIVTDSNSGIVQEPDIVVLPMPFMISGETYFEGISLTRQEFYQRLDKGDDVVTSQPSAGSVMELWDKLLLEYEEVVHIPMSSGLSGSCETAIMLAQDYGGKVSVVNNQRISVTQRQSVLDAVELAKKGKNAAQIKELLEADKYNSSVYIMVDTLKYLKKGGRITPAAAAIGMVLNLKPVLQIQGEKLDAFSKARGTKQGKRIMLDAMKKDFETRFAEAAARGGMRLQIAHTNNAEAANEFRQEVEAVFPGVDIHMDELPLSIACHIGPGALAIACTQDLIV